MRLKKRKCRALKDVQEWVAEARAMIMFNHGHSQETLKKIFSVRNSL